MMNALSLELMLPPITLLLFGYGLTFWLQNKLPSLHGRSDFTDKLLACTFCLGTHSGGWVAWLVATGLKGGWLFPTWWQNGLSFVCWAFTGAAFCYTLDAVVRWLEANTGE
jgi:hypothetical protein